VKPSPMRMLSFHPAKALTLDRRFSDLVNQAHGLTTNAVEPYPIWLKRGKPEVGTGIERALLCR
jgi:hypothetical protein